MRVLRQFSNNLSLLDKKARGSLIRIPIAVLVSLAIMLPIAGRWSYLGGWLNAAWMLVYTGVYSVWLIAANPELFNQRMNIFLPGTKRFDKVFWIVWRSLTFAMIILAPLDVRLGWSTVPAWLAWSAFILSLLLSCVGVWPIIINRHFEANVRIQTDRDHRVVDQGPYRIVRHPGYSLAVPGMFLMSLMMESFWAMIPATGIVIAFVVRTTLEDRTLRNELEGYEEYAQRVRWRLLPGIW
ncbi:isoprenylcysteine carboxylmethyltransferase family protein [bacterium]|nr:isoprenylcysteine carboxylmethyltransferase family protein [bacterium]